MRFKEAFASGVAVSSGIMGCVAQATAGLLHLFTTVIAFSRAGLFGGVVTFFLPAVSEIYWLIRLGPLSEYGLIVLTWAGLTLFGTVGMVFASHFFAEKSPSLFPEVEESILATTLSDLDHASRDLANRINNFGLDFLRQGRLNEAIEAFQQASEALTDAQSFRKEKVAQLEAINRTGSVDADLVRIGIRVDELATERRADLAKILYNLAGAFRKAQKLTEAMTISQEVVHLEPGSGLFRYALALDCEIAGRHEEALAEVKQLEELGQQDLSESLLDYIAERALYDPGFEDTDFAGDAEYWELHCGVIEKMIFLAEMRVQWYAFL
jgi:hypothetical protein